MLHRGASLQALMLAGRGPAERGSMNDSVPSREEMCIRDRRREYPAVPVPPQYGRFRDGAQRQYRQFGPAAHLPRKQGQPVPVHLRQRDSGPPHQEGDPFPRPAAHPCDRRCAEHDRGRLRLPHHDGQPHLRLPRQVRPPAAVDRPAGRRLGRVERDVRLRRAGRGVRARRQSRRDRDDRPAGVAELRFLDVQALRNVLDGVYLLRPSGQRHRGLQDVYKRQGSIPSVPVRASTRSVRRCSARRRSAATPAPRS